MSERRCALLWVLLAGVSSLSSGGASCAARWDFNRGDRRGGATEATLGYGPTLGGGSTLGSEATFGGGGNLGGGFTRG